jgi:tRNA G18 (ribose-2'-O)-methylase SpoU
MSGYSKVRSGNIDPDWDTKHEARMKDKCAFMYNIRDEYKDLPKEEARVLLQEKAFPAAIMMVNWEGDFNIGGVFRSGNCFNFSRMYYYGKKKRDKRAEVGVFNYSYIEYLDSFEKVKELKNNFKFIALENNINKVPQNIINYIWEPNSIILLGSESFGLPEEFQELCDDFIEIPMFGTCRSFNAASAASIAMYDYVSKYKK